MKESKIERLSRKLREVTDAFEMWQRAGLNEDVLVIYIHHKTKISQRDIRKMLTAQKAFFNNLIKDEVTKRLKGEYEDE